MSTISALGTNISVVKSFSPYWKPQTKAFLDASGIKKDSTVYFASTAYAQTGSEIWHSVDRFVRGIVEDGMWNKLIALYPFIGENYTQAKFNLVNPADTDAAHRLLQGATPVFDGKGVTFNGTNNYLRSNVIPSAQGAYNNFAIGSYTLTQDVGNILYGVLQGDDKRIICWPRYNATNSMTDTPGYSNRITRLTPNAGIGLWQYWIENNNLKWSVEDIDQVGINNISVVTMPDQEIYLGCENSGGPTGYSASEMMAWYYGINWVAADSHNMAIRLNRLMIDLKRVAV